MPRLRRLDALPRHNRVPDAPIEDLSDRELLTFFLGRTRQVKARELAARLLEVGGSIDGLARLSPTVITGDAGVSPQGALLLRAAFELGQRRSTLRTHRQRIDSVASVVEWARPHLIGLEHEEVWLLCLDARNVLRNSRRVAQGGLHGCALTAKDVLRPALRDGASAIVLVHNHPSGDPEPSDADVSMTNALDIACATVGLPLLDHVVVASDGASSLFELGVVGSQ